MTRVIASEDTYEDFGLSIEVSALGDVIIRQWWDDESGGTVAGGGFVVADDLATPADMRATAMALVYLGEALIEYADAIEGDD